MTWFINLSSPGRTETIDQATTLAEAEFLLGEYRLAYWRNPELRVWLSERSLDAKAGDPGPVMLAHMLRLKSREGDPRRKSRGIRVRSSDRSRRQSGSR